MAKKSRRVKSKSTGPRFTEAQMVRPVVGPDGSDLLPKSQVEPKASLAEEYQYVATDLKRIGAIAVVMLVVMIVLAFVLV